MSTHPPSRFILLVAAVLIVLPAQIATASDHRVRVGVLKFGTVNWELDAIVAHRLAEREGIDLQVVELGSKRATSVALQGGAADVIVTDWIWVSRQRAEGRDYAFVPYSLAVGGLMVRPDARLAELADLRGRKVGIAGGPVDKSWLLLQAYAKRAGTGPLGVGRAHLRRPAAAQRAHQARGAAGGAQLLALQRAARGAGDAGARHRRRDPARARHRAADPAARLGLRPRWADGHREALHGFLRASYAAKHLLLESDEEWTRLAPRMKVSDPATAAALRDAWRAGVPRSFGAEDREAAARTFAILAHEGARSSSVRAATLAPGTFWTEFDPARWQR